MVSRTVSGHGMRNEELADVSCETDSFLLSSFVLVWRDSLRRFAPAPSEREPMSTGCSIG